MEGEWGVKNNLVINIHSYTDNDSSIQKPVNKNYKYWFALMEYFLNTADAIEIHCWNEEIETINEMNSIKSERFEIIKEENLTIFKAPTSKSLNEYLLKESVNDESVLKWFTFNLEKLNVPLFHSGHWGTELFIPGITQEDIDMIQIIIPIDSDLQQY